LTQAQDNILENPMLFDEEALRRNWGQYLEALADEEDLSIPLKRLQYQAEQDPVCQEIMKRWSRMNGNERLSAWKGLLERTERLAKEILPTCVQCGECCREGSPTLHIEDMELLRREKIPWNQLVTLRRGEPVRSPFDGNLFFLLDERVKVREREGTRECVFLDDASSQCTIYVDRPVQCRAQACWSPETAKELAEQPYLTRRDIFRVVETLLDLIVEHDKRCSFENLQAGFKRLEESKGETVDEVIDLLAYEDHFRRFFSREFKIPEDVLDLVFGRSFADLVSIFGFKVEQEEDGSRQLVPEE